MQLLNTALLNTAAQLNAALMKKVVRCRACCVLALISPGIILAQDAAAPNQPTVPSSHVAAATASPVDEAALLNLPDSPGAAWAKDKDDKDKDQYRVPQHHRISNNPTPPACMFVSSLGVTSKDWPTKDHPQNRSGRWGQPPPKRQRLTA